MKKRQLIPISYEKLIIDSSIKSLTVPEDAKYAEIKVESNTTSGANPIRYLCLGNNTIPSITNGISLNNLDFFDILGHLSLNRFRVTQTMEGIHTLHIQYYK